MRTNKYIYLFILQGFYKNGWEDLCASTSFREMLRNKKEYLENEHGKYRIIRRREPNMEQVA